MSNTQRPNTQIIDEVPYGVYVWEMPDGKWVGDDMGNYLLSPLCMRGNIRVVNALSDAVKYYSKEAWELGKPVFLSGRRPVSDEELEEQVDRYKEGLIPDKLDLPAHLEEQKKGFFRRK